VCRTSRGRLGRRARDKPKPFRLGLLTAEELASYADETVDIAQGLGEHVTMLMQRARGGWRLAVECS
jgi:hypothetical protein